MALTRYFKETIMERVKTDPEYADALFEQGVQAMLDGDVAVGKSIIRDYISVLKYWQKRSIKAQKASCACSVKKAIRTRAICLLLLANCNASLKSNYTSAQLLLKTITAGTKGLLASDVSYISSNHI